MDARYLILALQPADQFPDAAGVGVVTDNLEQRGFFVRRLISRGVQQFAHAKTRLLGQHDIEQRAARVVFLVERIQQHVWRVGAARTECLLDPSHNLGTALDHGRDELGKGLLADQGGQRFEQRHGDWLVGVRQGRHDGQDGLFAAILEFRDQFLGSRARRISAAPDLGDKPIRFQIRKKAHKCTERELPLVVR